MNADQLTERAIVVTGSGSGIGLAIARMCLQRGARVLGYSLEATPIGDERFIGIEGDVTDEPAVKAAIDHAARAFGRVDGLVCNAGIMRPGDIESVTVEQLRRHFEVNLVGYALAGKHAAPHMKAAGGGAIVNCASIMAFTSAPDSVAYTVSKTAALGLTRATALDLAPHGIRCNTVCPGTIDTPMLQRYLDEQPDPARERNRLERLFPLLRLGEPEDVAACCCFLLSDDARYVTGAELVVDGGCMISGTNE